RIFVVGGFTTTQASDAVEEYTPAANSWRTLANGVPRLNGARYLPGFARAADGKLYVAGGSFGNSPKVVVNTVEQYDPTATNDVWPLVAQMSGARRPDLGTQRQSPPRHRWRPGHYPGHRRYHQCGGVHAARRRSSAWPMDRIQCGPTAGPAL